MRAKRAAVSSSRGFASSARRKRARSAVAGSRPRAGTCATTSPSGIARPVPAASAVGRALATPTTTTPSAQTTNPAAARRSRACTSVASRSRKMMPAPARQRLLSALLR